MISVNNLGLRFGGRALFEEVNLQFTPGNCYGVIGANGAGKSTFLKILAGDIEPTSGDVSILTGKRLAVLRQNHFAYDDMEVLKTVIAGHKRLYDIMVEKEAMYLKTEFTEEEGIRLSELEGEFAELDGWEADSSAATLLNGLGIGEEFHYTLMKDLEGDQKVKVLLAQALFGNPDVLLLDEPTNHLDRQAIHWLEKFLGDFENTVIVVSHDRHFLNRVCTNICDIDFGKVQMYVGNYDFWYEASQLALRQAKEQNKKTEAKMKELQEFIQRFSANASKSKQATSRKKMLDKLNLEDIRPSTRRYPFIDFKPEREVGNDLLRVKNLSYEKDGEVLFKDVEFMIQKGEKVVLVGDGSSITAFFDVIAGEAEPTTGDINWGITTSRAYFPKDNNKYFDGCKLSLVDWLRQYTKDQTETFIRGWLGRMLFSGEEALKEAHVLSGGEKVRCMLSRMMLSGANVLILDEPTNHLDLESITALNNGLINFKGTMFLSSHDEQLCETVGTRVLEIGPDKFNDYQVAYADWEDQGDN